MAGLARQKLCDQPPLCLGKFISPDHALCSESIDPEHKESSLIRTVNPECRLDLERLIGPVCAWLNNDLLRGFSLRLNCEWVTDHQHFYIVQIDQEDEDFVGIN